MKKLFFLFLLLPLLSNAQQPAEKENKMFGHWGVGLFAVRNTEASAFTNIGMGFLANDHLGIGADFELFIFKKNTGYVQASADFRYFIAGMSKHFSPYLAFQPGFILYSKTVKIGATEIKTIGNFSVNALFGVAYRPEKGVGLFFNVGYSNISFTTNDITTHTGGLKAGAGLFF